MATPDPALQQDASSELTTEQRADGIIVYHVHDTRRATADALREAYRLSDAQYYAAGRHSRSLIDMRGAGWPTPYATEQMRRLAMETPAGIRESTAVVVSASFAARLFDLMIRKLTPKAQQTTRIFPDMESAIAWLDQRLAELGE